MLADDLAEKLTIAQLVARIAYANSLIQQLTANLNQDLLDWRELTNQVNNNKESTNETFTYISPTP